MKFLRIFHIGEKKILAKNHSVPGTVIMVQKSYLYVVKKPVRLFINENNTMYSHFITFRYAVEDVTYQGKLFVPPQFRCPQKGETIEIFYDPEKPEQYACYAFGPNVKMIGW